MDRMPGGGAPDGAFERFLTAALATIITIMFSWRLLQDENEASGYSDRDRSPPAVTSADLQAYNKARSRYKKLSERSSNSPSRGSHYDISLDELDYSDTESSVNVSTDVRDNVMTDRYDPVTVPTLRASPPSISHTSDLSYNQLNMDSVASDNTGSVRSSSPGETLTTWDDYSWQEDTGEEQEFVIKTRRSVRHFAKHSNTHPSHGSNENNHTDESNGITPLTECDVQTETPGSHPQLLSLSQRLASFEYSDTGGDSGYVDLYPDVETDESEESSDEEHEYEIQVSDSDSDSLDDRGGAFYGMNTLDTIFEEFESDIEEDICDKVIDMCDKDVQNSDKGDTGPYVDETGRYGPDIPLNRESRLDNISNHDKTGVLQTPAMLNEDQSDSSLSDSHNHVQESIEHSFVSRVQTETPNITDDEIRKQITIHALHTVDNDTPIRAETPEYVVSTDIPSAAGDITDLNSNVNSGRSENTDSIDLVVNNSASLNSGIFQPPSPQDKSVTGDLSNINSEDRVSVNNGAQHDTHSNTLPSNAPHPSTLQIEFSKLQEKMKVPRLGQLQKEYPNTDTSEDNSPSSPVRNLAIDNLADDKFSDTESCSSESVITVISVKSTDSDQLPIERGDLTRDSCQTPVHSAEDLASGESGHLAPINVSDSSYEHNSLVSGFLNDSLNSLLSANNVNDTECDSDVDISELEHQNSSNKNNINSEKVVLKETIEDLTEIQTLADDSEDQSENSSKTSSADSLSIELARVQETNQINTELSNQAASNGMQDDFRIESRISDALASRDLRILGEHEISDRFNGSDSSSDSSDPPLREYDPDDDDLAAFQFNQDIDNDSFYLLVGDEGSLRNYETFTNLNSVGLSSDYNDAFTSRAFPDEARGFTFSRTEDLGTQFRTQGYFTPRSHASDTDSQSDKGLSPIVSEDEEIVCLAESDYSPVTPPQSEKLDPTPRGPPGNVTADKYKDAALSLVHTSLPGHDSEEKQENKSIDFQKYIIHPECKQDDSKSVDQEGPDSQIGDKDSEKIDEEFIKTKGVEIDNDQCAIDISGVNTLNYTVGTNTARVPQNSPTETPHVNLSDAGATRTETDLDLDLCEGVNRVIELKGTNVDIDSCDRNNGNVTGFKPVRVETNVDDIFTERDDEDHSVGPVHQPDRALRFKKSGRVKIVNRAPKETCIDDLFVEIGIPSGDTNIARTVLDTSSRPTAETNVDDLFVNQPSESTPASRQGVQTDTLPRETNIDDVLRDTVSKAPVTPPHSPIETNIDVLSDTVSKAPVTPPHSPIETNIDDIYDDVIPVKVCPVQSTPLKHVAPIETNVDDIVTDTSPAVNDIPSHHVQSVETFVDDLFSDAGLDEFEEESEKRDEIGVNESNKLSYETFVDDLFSDVLSVDDTCSSLNVDQNTPSSKRAINDETSSEFKDSPNRESTRSVQEDVVLRTTYSSPLSPPGRSNYSSPGQIVRDTDSNRTSDPGRSKQTSLSQTDNVSADSGSDNLNVTATEYSTECQTGLPTQSGSSIAKPIDQQICVPDSIVPQICRNTSRGISSVPSPYRQNNVNTIDVITDDNDVITLNNSTDNNETVEKSKSERETAINDIPNNAELSIKASYEELNGQKQPVVDHNANVSLPKPGGLNIVRNSDNGSDLGLHPVEHSYRERSPLSVDRATKQPTVPEDENATETYGITNTDDIELKIVEDSDISPGTIKENTSFDQESSIGSCSINSDDESLSSIEESYNNLQNSYNSTRLRGLSDSSIGRVVRSPVVKPSAIFGNSKDYQGVKRRIHKHQLKKYTSILQQPVATENQHAHLANLTPEKPPSVTRLKVLQSRQRFLSAENLSNNSFEDRFLHYRTSLTSSTPRKYLKRHERALADMQSTESLPADMSAMDFMNSSYGSYNSMDRIHSLPVSRQIEELYHSRYSSANSSFERHEYDKLHANCMFSPQKREEIRHTTKSLENMFEQLLRYGSVSSLAEETDLDTAAVTDPNSTFLQGIDISDYISFQYPLERAASMSALIGSSDGHRLPRKPKTGRFASRNVPKSKSLQTLETNLDDVFAAEDEISGELKKSPSVHELRVSKSLSKLNVPDWYRKSSFSRSGSTQSLFTYASRQGSTSTLGSSIYPASITTSPSPSVTPGSGAVIISKRVTATPSTPSTAKLLRAPLLPTTPERAPIHNIPPPVSLPSDRFRKSDKKELKPIAIVPFAKLREMFEKKSQEHAQARSSTTPVTSPVREKPPSKVRFEPMSPVRDSSSVTAQSPVRRETAIDNEPVRTVSPVPPVPERKPILADSSRKAESAPVNGQPRKMQVHFSDENQHMENVSRPQESSNNVRHNGTAPSTNVSSSSSKQPSDKPATKKSQGIRASLPLPQFRFRRPGIFASKGASSSSSTQQSANSQSKKGKRTISRFTDNKHDCGYCDLIGNEEACLNNLSEQTWLHVLENKTKLDGETLFEFLQKRRYSSILENGFAEQLEELQDRDVAFNFPVVSLGKHAGGEIVDHSPDLQVVLTNAYSNNCAPIDYMNNKLRGDATVDDILDGLLLLDGHRTGRLRMDEDGRIVPKHPEDFSPDTPPGFTVNSGNHPVRDMYRDTNDNLCGVAGSEYTLVTCENPDCKRETNLKEAKQYFKTCHSCFTYYCSRECRKQDWGLHKKVCIYSRINSACKHVIKFINRQPELQYQCSRIARRGYLAQGRGCVMFAFPDISSSEDFLKYGFDSLWVPPVYVSLRELPNASMLGSKLGILTETCLQYNPELKYVIHVAIVIPPKLPVRPAPRRIESIIQKSAKLRLSPAHMHLRDESNTDIPTTLILTAVPGNQHADDPDGRKTRELCFINIQRKLRQRGVSLRHQFPDVYNKLIDFVSDAKHFTPMIIYPSDGRTGRKFMCVIIPESEPEIEWIRDPNLFHELDVLEDVDTSTPNLSLNLQEVLL